MWPSTPEADTKESRILDQVQSKTLSQKGRKKKTKQNNKKGNWEKETIPLVGSDTFWY